MKYLLFANVALPQVKKDMLRGEEQDASPFTAIIANNLSILKPNNRKSGLRLLKLVYFRPLCQWEKHDKRS